MTQRELILQWLDEIEKLGQRFENKQRYDGDRAEILGRWRSYRTATELLQDLTSTSQANVQVLQETLSGSLQGCAQNLRETRAIDLVAGRCYGFIDALFDIEKIDGVEPMNAREIMDLLKWRVAAIQVQQELEKSLQVQGDSVAVNRITNFANRKSELMITIQEIEYQQKKEACMMEATAHAIRDAEMYDSGENLFPLALDLERYKAIVSHADTEVHRWYAMAYLNAFNHYTAIRLLPLQKQECFHTIGYYCPVCTTLKQVTPQGVL